MHANPIMPWRRLTVCAGLAGLLAAAAGCGRAERRAAPPAGERTAPPQVFELSPDAGETPETPLVTVDGKVFTRGEADEAMRQLLRAQGVAEQQLGEVARMMGPRLRERLTDRFVDTTLLQQEAERRGIVVGDAEIDGVLSNLAARLPPGATLEEALSASGISLEQLRRDIRANESMRKLYEAETAKVTPATEEDVAAYYDANAGRFSREEEVSARHILIGCREEEDTAAHAAAKAKAEELRRQLLDGTNFAALAAAHSDCPSKTAGGDLGFFPRGRMVKVFEEAAFALPSNAISEVVRSPYGYHIIQVTGRKTGGVQPLDEVREEAREQLAAGEREKAFAGFVEELRGKATIVYATNAAPAAATENSPSPATAEKAEEPEEE
jgi:parvulin-like peptidyl-prolyl isomerase